MKKQTLILISVGALILIMIAYLAGRSSDKSSYTPQATSTPLSTTVQPPVGEVQPNSVASQNPTPTKIKISDELNCRFLANREAGDQQFVDRKYHPTEDVSLMQTYYDQTSGVCYYEISKDRSKEGANATLDSSIYSMSDTSGLNNQFLAYCQYYYITGNSICASFNQNPYKITTITVQQFKQLENSYFNN